MSLNIPDGRLIFVRPINTQSNFIQNQQSGMINSPESGQRVPSDETQSLIMKNHQHISNSAAYVEGVVAKADAEKALTAKLAAYAREPNEERRGRLLDVRA